VNGLSPILLAKLAYGAGNVVEPGATDGWLAFIMPGRDLTRSRHSPHAQRPGIGAMCSGHSDRGFGIPPRDHLDALARASAEACRAMQSHNVLPKMSQDP
jgi:hypothetical protein